MARSGLLTRQRCCWGNGCQGDCIHRRSAPQNTRKDETSDFRGQDELFDRFAFAQGA
jgi:hypothetical protein